MKHRWLRIPLSTSRSYRTMVDRAIADAFASLEPKADRDSLAIPGLRRRRTDSTSGKAWAWSARRRPEDSLA